MSCCWLTLSPALIDTVRHSNLHDIEVQRDAESALLFSTTLTLSSWPRNRRITPVSSSEMSSLKGSNNKTMRSTRSANLWERHRHETTATLSRGRVDGVEAVQSHEDAIAAT